MKCFLFSMTFVSCFAEAEPNAHGLQLEEKVIHDLQVRKGKFDTNAIGYSFTYQMMLLEKLDPKADRDLITMLSKAFIKRYFQYYIQVELGLRKEDKAVEMAFSNAVAKRLIDVGNILDDKLNYGSMPDIRVKTPYGLLLDDQANDKLSTMFREHVRKIISP